MNAKQNFQEANRVTKEALKYNVADYRATFSASLKAIHAGMKKEQASAYMKLISKKKYSTTYFTKSIEEMTASRLNSKHLVGTVSHKIISNMPSVKAKLGASQEKVNNYYKSRGGSTTMC